MEEHRNHVHVAFAVPPSHNPLYNPDVLAIAKRSGLPVQPVSGYRPVDPETNNQGYHVQGLATDFAGFNQDALALYFSQQPGLLELIHRSNKGDYGYFCHGASAPANTSGSSGVASSLTGFLGPLGSFVGKLADPKFWIRVAYLVGGAVAIIWGLSTLSGGKLKLPSMEKGS